MFRRERNFDSIKFRKPGRLAYLARKYGIIRNQALYWSWYEPRNFGDWIGPYLYHAISGDLPFYDACHKPKNEKIIFTAGSILRKIQDPDFAIVWGSGIISRSDEFRRPKETLAVRGPISADRMRTLGYECPDVFGDPAILMPRFFSPDVTVQPGRVGLIPHFVDLEEARRTADMHVHVVDVTRSVEAVIRDILSCEATVSSSLHGLIISHAYGRKSAWMRSSKPIMGDDTKFYDYFESANISEAYPHDLGYQWGRNRLYDTAFGSPFPRFTHLHDKLLESCPF